MNSRFLVGALCAIATVTIWAGWLVAMRVGMGSNLAVPDLIALRFGVAGLIMLPIILRRGWALDQLGWTGLAAIAIGGGAAYTLTVGIGLMFAPVSHASAFTQGVLPLTTAVMAAFVLKETFNTARKLGIALIIAGGIVIAGLGILSVNNETIGHAVFLAATLLWASYTVALRKARLDALHATAIAAVASLIVYIPVYFALFGTRLLAAPLHELVWQGLYQGVLTAVVSLVLFGRAVALIGASGASAFISLGPGFAALLAIPVLNEWPTAEDWAGIAVISIGVYLASGGPLPLRR